MPFKSKQQMKACFASKGFHGKIDCDEWAKDTNYKSLPNKKQLGGSNMYRPKNCKKCGGKMMQIGGPTPNAGPGTTLPYGSPVNRRPQTIDEANAYARNIAMRQGLVSGENTHVGNTLPNYRDAAGNLLPDTWTPIPQSSISSFVPSDVKELQWSSESNLPYYIDPKSGDMVYTSRDNFYLPRFQQNRGQSAQQLGINRVAPVPNMTAMRMMGGLQKMEGGGPKIPYTTADDPLIPGVNAPLDDEIASGNDVKRAMYNGSLYANPVQEGFAKGIIETPKDFQGSGMEWYNWINSPQKPQKKNNGVPQNMLQELGIAMQGVRTGLGEISGRVERGRQNQYDYNQQTALGQMNPMPTTDYQPNPYSLYAKYGGSLKQYQQGGMSPRYQGLRGTNPQDSLTYRNAFNQADSLQGEPYPSGWDLSSYGPSQYRSMNNALGAKMSKNDIRMKNYATRDVANEQAAYQDFLQQQQRKILETYGESMSRKPLQQGGQPSYNMSILRDKPSKDDSAMYKIAFDAMANQENYAMNQYIDYQRYGIPMVNPNGGPTNMNIFNSDVDKKNAYQDAINQAGAGYNRARNVVPFLPQINPPQKYGGLQHVDYFGPPFSNGANFKFSNSDKMDNKAVRRVSSAMLRGWASFKKGGIHIKPENKGKFTDYCGGKVTQECISRGKNSPSATIRKRATFAQNARKWN